MFWLSVHLLSAICSYQAPAEPIKKAAVPAKETTALKSEAATAAPCPKSREHYMLFNQHQAGFLTCFLPQDSFPSNTIFSIGQWKTSFGFPS